MKALKIIALSLVGLIVVLAIGAYFFFKKAFTPEPNHLELTESSGFIPIQWAKSKHSDIAALLLPITIEGVPDTFYLQFDTGAPSTLLYKRSMLAIRERYHDKIGAIDSTSTTIEQTFQLGNMDVHSKHLKLYERNEKPIDWSGSKLIKIGTLGADIIDKKLTVIDFKKNRCFFGEELPDIEGQVAFHDLKFKLRKVLIPAEVAGKKRKLVHDTGTSGFEFITNKGTWKKLSKEGAEPEEAFKVRSWKRQLTAFHIASDKEIKFNPMNISLNQVTYIKGASFWQQAGMRLTGMGGMIGNQVFMNKLLILDCPNKRYSIVEPEGP